MDMKTVFKKLTGICIDHDITFNTAQFSDGIGLFISLEKVENGTAITIPNNHEGLQKVMKYIKKNKIPFDYRGYYTSILIKSANY